MSVKHGYPVGFRIEGNPQDYLTKEQIESEGWSQAGESPNNMLYYFEKTVGKHAMAKKWRLKFYKHSTYLAPLEICYLISNEPFAYDAYEGWSEEFGFEVENLAEFQSLMKMLCI